MGKLFVIHAQQAPIAVIIRRGPSHWSHVIAWNTQEDLFEQGAWVKGRIHPEKCDLSFDGKLLVYFLHKEGHTEDKLPNTWTALSRPPWLTALALWPQGDTYGGGGRFTRHRQLALRATCPWETRVVCHPKYPNTVVRIDPNPSPDLQRTANLIPDAFWSGYDLRGDILYTLGDKVFRVSKSTGSTVELADFSDLTPNPQPPPEWARTFSE